MIQQLKCYGPTNHTEVLLLSGFLDYSNSNQTTVHGSRLLVGCAVDCVKRDSAGFIRTVMWLLVCCIDLINL